MDNFNETYENANKLMMSALAKYRKGDFEGGNSDREKANELFDLAEQEMSTDMYKTSMLYGENKNFGIIYKVIEENAKKLFETKEGRKKIGKIIKMIKENKCLKNQFDLYNAFNRKNVTDKKRYISEALNMYNKNTKKDILINNAKLIGLIRNMGLDECIDICNEDIDFFNSVEYSILNEKNIHNLNEFISNENIIKEHMDRNENTEEDDNDISECLDNTKNELLSELNEDELKFIQEYSNIKEGREEIFEQHKNKIIEMVDSEISKSSDEDIDKWKNIHERISHKNYDKNKFLSDIAEMIDIENQLS